MEPQNVIAEGEYGGTRYLIHQTEEEELIEQYDDGVLSPPEFVGSAPPYTKGSYVFFETKRAFYCQNRENALQDFVYSYDDEAWEPGELAEFTGPRARPDTEVAAVRVGEDDVYVFYQGESGQIHSVHQGEDGAWERVDNIPMTNAPGGASIFALCIGNTVRVFYAHQDKSIHEMAFQGGRWADAPVPRTSGDLAKNSISAAASDDGQYALQFADSSGNVYTLEKDELVLFGKYTSEGFQKAHDAEGWNARGSGAFSGFRPK